MSEDLLRKHWYSLFNELKERWPDLTQSDLYYISGDMRKLIEVIEKRRHLSHEEAQAEIQDLMGRLQLRQRIA
jgi:hypothetical protein